MPETQTTTVSYIIEQVSDIMMNLLSIYLLSVYIRAFELNLANIKSDKSDNGKLCVYITEVLISKW